MDSKQGIKDVEDADESLELNAMLTSKPKIDENKGLLRQRAVSIEDDMELRWDDDDVDDVSVTNEDALLEEVTMENDFDMIPTDSKKLIDVLPKKNIEEVSPHIGINKKNIDNNFEPAKAHGLNKPDMMLEILTQELSDLSDDEDLTNLKMSPDLEVEACNIDISNKIIISEKDIRNQSDFVGEEKSDDLFLSDNIVSDCEKNINNDLSEEGNLAADLLRKELAMDTNDGSIAITLEDEDLLLRDDIENQLEDSPIVELDLNEEDLKLDTLKVCDVQSKAEISTTTTKINLSKPLPDSEINVDLTLEKDVIDITSIEEAKSLEMDIEREATEMTEVVESAYMKIKKYPNLENIELDKLNSSQIGIKFELPKDDSIQLQLQEVSSKPVDQPTTQLSLKFSETSEASPKTLEFDVDSIKVQSPISEPKETNKMRNLFISPKPSTSGLGKNEVNSNKEFLEKPKDIEPQPSTSNQNPSLFSSSTQDIEDVPEPSDSLGLLSESFRKTGDEEMEDEDLEEEEGDDYDHFDESSNQMTAEHSEDSNQHHSDEVNETPNQTPTAEKDFNFTITGVTTEMAIEKMETDEKEKSNDKTDIKIKTNHSNIEEEKQNSNNVEDISKENKADVETKVQKKTTKPKEMSYVDLEESSSEEDAQEPITKNVETDQDTGNIHENNISKEDIETEQSKRVEVTSNKEEQILEKQTKTKSQGLEVFNLDSDDEEVRDKQENQLENSKDQISAPLKCINKSCSRNSSDYYRADNTTVNFYDPERKKRGHVCQNCLEVVEKRNQILISGIRDLVPLLDLNPGRPADELVEISDSESEEEAELRDPDESTLGEKGARFTEEKLCALLNETWQRFELDDRLEHAEGQLQEELEALQKESLEINQMLDDCQVNTDKLRTELYATFECDIKELPAVVIYDVPNCSYTCVDPSGKGSRLLKRKKSSPSETPAKRSAIPLGYTPLADKNFKTMESRNDNTEDENQEVSVVHLSVEAAPPDLPPAGEMTHPPLKVGMTVYASKNVFGSWMKAKIVEITPKTASMPFTMCRVKFEHKLTKPTKILPARCLAYADPPDVRMTIGTRVIALFKDITMRDSFYSGIVAEIPNPVNNYRYLIFFDDGYAQYASHSSARAVCERSSLVWEEVQPKSRDFVRKYLLAYPERPMVRLHPGQSLKTEWKGNWWSSVVMSVDASLVEVQFTNIDRREWIYRGSTRLAPLYLELQAAERHRPRALPRTQPHSRTNMPYVEYTRSDEQTSKLNESSPQQQQTEELRRQRAVAKKSTTEVRAPPPPSAQNLDNITSRVVYYTPKKQVKPLKMVPHACSARCRRQDVLSLKELRTYNPLAKPLLSGWERQIVRFKGSKCVSYVSPCGRRLRDVTELHRYLRAAASDLPIDLFDFNPSTHCLAEFVLNKCYVGKKDLSHGKENVPVPCVNYYDESLPEFCSYNTERTPTAGVPLNLDPEFLCGCDCEDDCKDKSKCACWKLTMEGARTIGLEGDVGYVYKRLPEPLPSGIYECNSRCKCKDTCLNRVAQHPLQLKLQVFKTLNRGWGIRALNDIPKGAFVCVYAGNLLTDATANLDGLNEGDEYLAELDYIEVVEQMKEGYEEDIPEKIKKLDQAELANKQLMPDEEPESSSSEDEGSNNNGEEDDDFRPGYIGLGVTEFNKRLRRRDSKVENKETPVKKANENYKPEVKKENEEECITISDDEEVREPSCFTAAAGMGANEFKSKYRSVRTLFGEDEACYIMDAKVQGNIGRYLNHSCVPNVFVQNVFVDTHDPRFPWVAFFALRAVRAGGELTWNYNYDVGSVPGKVLYCYCGAPTCRGRLL